MSQEAVIIATLAPVEALVFCAVEALVFSFETEAKEQDSTTESIKFSHVFK
jgi:hypothetical protein